MADVEAALGSLVASGFSLTEILSWPWIQIFQSARAITAYHASMVNAVAGPLLQGLDAGMTDAKAVDARSSSATRKKDASSLAQEHAKLSDLVGFGVPVSVSVSGEARGKVGQGALRGALFSGDDDG